MQWLDLACEQFTTPNIPTQEDTLSGECETEIGNRDRKFLDGTKE